MALKSSADAIRRDATRRLSPTAEVLSREYVACEEAVGGHLGRKFDLNVVCWTGGLRVLTEARGDQRNQFDNEPNRPALHCFILPLAVVAHNVGQIRVVLLAHRTSLPKSGVI